MVKLLRSLLGVAFACCVLGDSQLRGTRQDVAKVMTSEVETNFTTDNTSTVEVDYDAAEWAGFVELQAARGLSVNTTEFTMLKSVRDVLPPPPCKCIGRNQRDGYRNGASATAKELCMSPWGGRHSSCYPLNWNGQCNWGARKCLNAPVPAEPSNQENATDFEKPSRSVNATGPDDAPCLCVFDVDRTLTAKQWTFKNNSQGNQICSGTRPVWGAQDSGYGWGTLTLAAAAAGGISKTDCGKCYVGICSHGPAGDRNEKIALANEVLDAPLYQELAKEHWDAKWWTYRIRIPAKSPLVAGVPEGQKQFAVEGILAWYWSKGAKIPRERVWFFDDKLDNSANFAHTGMNAQQISCASRDMNRWPRGSIGFCGAMHHEFLRIPGVHDCGNPPSHELAMEHARRFNESRRNGSGDGL